MGNSGMSDYLQNEEDDKLVWSRSLYNPFKKASFSRFCEILYMCYNIIQNLIMSTILKPAIYNVC